MDIISKIDTAEIQYLGKNSKYITIDNWMNQDNYNILFNSK